MTVEAVLDSERGLIVAPAGCGKTHLITETLNINAGEPYLVLTHTTAGVAALKPFYCCDHRRMGTADSKDVSRVM
jgi:hypothetical protein